MPIVAEHKGTNFPKAPAGVHRAVCIAVYDLGSQPGFEGVGLSRKVLIMWELSDEFMTDGRPFAVSEEYTLSLNEKANLRKKLEAWRGRPFSEAELKGFDVANLLGKPCQLMVAHGISKKGKEFAEVTSIMPLAKGMQVPEPINDLRQYSITDSALPEGMPNWIAKKIGESAEKKPGHPATTAPAGSTPYQTPTDAGDPPF